MGAKFFHTRIVETIKARLGQTTAVTGFRLANVIAGFDPRPWEEHAPSFAMPNQSEWEAVIRQVKAQCEDPANKIGFPDVSSPNGFKPAFNIYAWNEYGEVHRKQICLASFYSFIYLPWPTIYISLCRMIF